MHLKFVELNLKKNFTDFFFLVADLPGLVLDSHKNKGLGIGFLRHAERCSTLAMVLDLSESEPWKQLDALRSELKEFSPELADRPQLVIANKIDLPEAQVCIFYFSNYNVVLKLFVLTTFTLFSDHVNVLSIGKL